MYELLLVGLFGWFILRSFSFHETQTADIPQRITNRVGKLWGIAHQGMRTNRLLRAEKALLAILKIDEKNSAAYNRLGILYAKQKEYKDAIDCFEIACGIESSPSSLHNLGLIYYETENYEKASVAFEDAIKMDDSMAARHIALAKTLEHLGNEKLMLNHLEKAVQLEPTKESFTLLSKAYRKHGQVEKADIMDDKIEKIKSRKKSKIRPKLRVRRAKRVVM